MHRRAPALTMPRAISGLASRRLFGLVPALMVIAAALCAEPAMPLVIQRQDGVIVNFEVELATTTLARQQGLMGRQALPRRHGMLFDFEHEQPVSMWMKNTLVPLDMLFINDQGVVVSLHAEAQPESLQEIVSSKPVRYVMEINGGESAVYAIRPGDQVVYCLRCLFL